MPLYPPLYNSPADFAMNGHVAIPMPRSAPASGAGMNAHPPPCPSPNCNHSTGPLLPSSPIDFPAPAHFARRRAKGSTCRVFFTISVFCVGCLVLYFTLAHIYGTDAISSSIGADASAVSVYQRFPRSEQTIEMDEILNDFKAQRTKMVNVYA